MLGSKAARLAAIGAAVALALGVVFYPTDEKRVRQATEALVSAANEGPNALAQALDQYAAPNVTVSADELPEPLVGQAAIVEAARRVSQLGVQLRLHADAIEVRVEGKRARLTADLAASQAEVPELRRPRHSVLVFEKHAAGFRLLSAEIGAERQDLPEARP
ncbi:MAG TPA: hypothetical protein VHB79_09710 [Polyangiaceae bacterium]|nr:hypothetical protein [Polyangiaceae bacterium]